MSRKTIIGAIQIGSFIAFGYLLVLVWAPSYSCRPVAELAGLPSIPTDARCYNISHGEVWYHTHCTARDDRVRFALLTLVVAILHCVLLYTYFKYPDSPLARWSSRRRRRLIRLLTGQANLGDDL